MAAMGQNIPPKRSHVVVGIQAPSTADDGLDELEEGDQDRPLMSEDLKGRVQKLISKKGASAIKVTTTTVAKPASSSKRH